MYDVFTFVNRLSCSVISRIFAMRADINRTLFKSFAPHFGDRRRIVGNIGGVILSKHSRSAHSHAFS